MIRVTEYDDMTLEMLQDVVPMLRQQLEKSLLDRNYVQLENVRNTPLCDYERSHDDLIFFHFLLYRTLSKTILILPVERSKN
jgi:hypothetical protein